MWILVTSAAIASLIRWIKAGISTSGRDSFGTYAVVGSMRLPNPAATITASLTTVINNPKGYNLSSITHHGHNMATVPEWRWITVAGALMVLQTLFDVAPKGPWNAPSFTRGVIGLAGLCCLYIGWFRYTFKRRGIIPSINRWQDPEKTWKLVVTFSFACFIVLLLVTKTALVDHLPETTGMIVLLIASLALLNGIYVGLVVSGPLSDKAEEE